MWCNLFSELGVLTWTEIETDEFESNKFLNKIKRARGYNFEVTIFKIDLSVILESSVHSYDDVINFGV